MELKVEKKLIEIISQFQGMTLKNAEFKEKEVKGKKLLTLELVFSDLGIYRTMVLIVDKNITVNECEDIYESVIK
jgi:hypothetical protein